MAISLNISQRKIKYYKIEFVIFIKTLLTQRSSFEKFCKFIDKKIVMKNINAFQKIIITIDCGNNNREFLREVLRSYSLNFYCRNEFKSNESFVKIVLL